MPAKTTSRSALSPMLGLWTTTMLAAAILAVMCARTAMANPQTQSPDYRAFTRSTFLPYINEPDRQMRRVPALRLSFGGRAYRATMDSGSTGVVVAAALIPNFDDLPKLASGRLTYTSSGRIMLGDWVETPMTIQGADGTSVQTEPMPVLAVTEVRCLEQARNCTPRQNPRNIAMIGIGFAREGDRQSQSTPDKNPFLRLDRSGGEERRGFVLTSTGVHIGLTDDVAGNGFRFIKLDKQAERPDWSAVPACISLDRQMPASCGTMLLDTGVSAMFMTVSPEQAGDNVDELPDGTEVTVLLGENGEQGELYSFRVGEESKVAPDMIHLRVSPKRTFVNTSYRLLNAFDFLYDADGGYAGFRPR